MSGKPVARMGDPTAPGGGHSDYTPTMSIEGSPNVFANGISVVREGDAYLIHVSPSPATHAKPVQDECSSTVFANGKGVARMGDAIDCGHTIAEGSPNVFAGG